MANKLKNIPNPNSMSLNEIQFINSAGEEFRKEIFLKPEPIKYRNTMVSIPENFLTELTNYLHKNPIEGKRSSFIVRVVGEYLNAKKLHNG